MTEIIQFQDKAVPVHRPSRTFVLAQGGYAFVLVAGGMAGAVYIADNPREAESSRDVALYNYLTIWGFTLHVVFQLLWTASYLWTRGCLGTTPRPVKKEWELLLMIGTPESWEYPVALFAWLVALLIAFAIMIVRMIDGQCLGSHEFFDIFDKPIECRNAWVLDKLFHTAPALVLFVHVLVRSGYSLVFVAARGFVPMVVYSFSSLLVFLFTYLGTQDIGWVYQTSMDTPAVIGLLVAGSVGVALFAVLTLNVMFAESQQIHKILSTPSQTRVRSSS